MSKEGSTHPASQPEMQTRLDVLADLLDSVGANDPNFSYVSVQPAAASLTVFRTGESDAAAEGKYKAQLPVDISIEFKPAVLTQSQSQQINRLVAGSVRSLREAGLRVQMYGVDHPGEAFTVWYSTGRINDAILKPYLIFGPGTVRFKYMPAPQTLDRGGDISPFGGGST